MWIVVGEIKGEIVEIVGYSVNKNLVDELSAELTATTKRNILSS